jgi:cell division protein FtsA
MKHNLITALDIGSSNIRSIMAKCKPDGQIEVLAVSQTPSIGIEKGIVKDIEAVSECISKVLKDIEHTSGHRVSNIYANITGEHIKTHIGDGRISIPVINQNEPGEITQEHIDQVITDAKNSLKIQKGFERAKILHGIPQGYVIDGQDDIHNPVKMNGFHLITKVYTIFADITPLRNLSKCIELAGYEMDQDKYVLNHIAIEKALLSDDERRLGTILIDIGGGTCDLSIFRRNVMEKVLVVPMAGAAITEDLAIGLKTTLSDAEKIKTKNGVAIAGSVDPEVEIDVEGISGRSASKKTQQLVSHVIQHRVEEIFSLCYDKLKNYYTPELVTAGIVLSGGMAKLDLIDQVVHNSFNLSVKIGIPNTDRLTGKTDGLQDTAYATCIGLLYVAASSEKETKAPLIRLGSIKTNKILDKIKQIYTDFTKA